MKISIVIILLVCVASLAIAEPWEKSIDANLLFAQNSYSDNWAGSETGSLIWTFNANMMAAKRLSDKLHNKSTFKLAFGQTHNQDEDSRDWKEPAKSTDLIDLESVLRYTSGVLVDPYAALRFESQFVDFADTLDARVINPIKLTESLGAAKVWIKEETRELSSRLGLGFRQFINRDVLTDAATLTRETESTNDAGLEIVSEFVSPFAAERISYSGKLTLFKALYYSEEDALKGMPNEDYWQAVDVNLENIFTASITKYLMVNLYMQLLYDKEVDLGGRFKQTLSLGLTYKFL